MTEKRRVSFAATAHVRLFEKEEEDGEEEELAKTLALFHPVNDNQTPEKENHTPTKLRAYVSSTPILDKEIAKLTPTPMKDLDENVYNLPPLSPQLFKSPKSPKSPTISIKASPVSRRSSLAQIAPFLKSTPRSASSLRHSFFPSDNDSDSDSLASPRAVQLNRKENTTRDSIAAFFETLDEPNSTPNKDKTVDLTVGSVGSLRFKDIEVSLDIQSMAGSDIENSKDSDVFTNNEFNAKAKSRSSIAPFFNGLPGIDSPDVTADKLLPVSSQSTPNHQSFKTKAKSRSSIAPFFNGLPGCDSPDVNTENLNSKSNSKQSTPKLGTLSSFKSKAKSRTSIAPFFNDLPGCDSPEPTFENIEVAKQSPKQNFKAKAKNRNSIAPFFRGMDGIDSPDVTKDSIAFTNESFHVSPAKLENFDKNVVDSPGPFDNDNVESSESIMELNESLAIDEKSNNVASPIIQKQSNSFINELKNETVPVQAPAVLENGRKKKTRTSITPFFNGLDGAETSDETSFAEANESFHLDGNLSSTPQPTPKNPLKNSITEVVGFTKPEFDPSSSENSLLLDESQDFNAGVEQDSLSNHNYFSRGESVEPGSQTTNSQSMQGSQGLVNDEEISQSKEVDFGVEDESDFELPFSPGMSTPQRNARALDFELSPVSTIRKSARISKTNVEFLEIKTPNKTTRTPRSSLRNTGKTPLRKALATMLVQSASKNLQNDSKRKELDQDILQSPQLQRKNGSPVKRQKLKQTPKTAKKAVLIEKSDSEKANSSGEESTEKIDEPLTEEITEPIEQLEADKESSLNLETESVKPGGQPETQEEECKDDDLMDETFLSIMDTSMVQDSQEGDLTHDTLDKMEQEDLVINNLESFLKAVGIEFKSSVIDEQSLNLDPIEDDIKDAPLLDQYMMALEQVERQCFKEGCEEIKKTLVELDQTLAGLKEDMVETRPLLFDDFASGSLVERETIINNLKLLHDYCELEVKIDWEEWRKLLLEKLNNDFQTFGELVEEDLQAVQPILDKFEEIVGESEIYMNELKENVDRVTKEKQEKQERMEREMREKKELAIRLKEEEKLLNDEVSSLRVSEQELDEEILKLEREVMEHTVRIEQAEKLCSELVVLEPADLSSLRDAFRLVTMTHKWKPFKFTNLEETWAYDDSILLTVCGQKKSVVRLDLLSRNDETPFLNSNPLLFNLDLLADTHFDRALFYVKCLEKKLKVNRSEPDMTLVLEINQIVHQVTSFWESLKSLSRDMEQSKEFTSSEVEWIEATSKNYDFGFQTSFFSYKKRAHIECQFVFSKHNEFLIYPFGGVKAKISVTYGNLNVNKLIETINSLNNGSFYAPRICKAIREFIEA